MKLKIGHRERQQNQKLVLEKINKIYKLLASLTKKKRGHKMDAKRIIKK